MYGTIAPSIMQPVIESMIKYIQKSDFYSQPDRKEGIFDV